MMAVQRVQKDVLECYQDSTDADPAIYSKIAATGPEGSFYLVDREKLSRSLVDQSADTTVVPAIMMLHRDITARISFVFMGSLAMLERAASRYGKLISF
ncbi:hypothetical protein NDU88_001363 [Pleurodeles waltl]|uniref:Uncharacterized protein n=1 Tax=Pleurodeles waltl TaxID=8319 RepID=A0AAV7MKQ3_PLEWA|nr:hypothetical protein NDU88_001363 [Pleurodeles waltl]